MASNPQHEPTMEEILASIRKIISEDSNESKSADARPMAASHDADTDVLELTHEVEEAPPPPPEPKPEVVQAKVMQMPQPAPIPVVSRTETEVVSQTIEETPVSSPASNESRPNPLEGIFSDTTRDAVHKAFARAPEQEEPMHNSQPDMPSVDGHSLEALFDRAVRETFGQVASDYFHDNTDNLVERMKPLFKDWMDAQFPAMLERAVRAEVARHVDDHFADLVRSEVAAKSRR